MIKAEPKRTKGELGIGVEFEYPSFLPAKDRDRIMTLELSAILEAIDNKYCKDIIVDAMEMYINSIFPDT